jgi:hypothetical protein
LEKAPAGVNARNRDPNRRFEFDKCSQPFIRTHNKASTVAVMRVRNEETFQNPIASRALEQSEQFKDDHDNDNYSDYVEDASVHAGD